MASKPPALIQMHILCLFHFYSVFLLADPHYFADKQKEALKHYGLKVVVIPPIVTLSKCSKCLFIAGPNFTESPQTPAGRGEILTLQVGKSRLPEKRQVPQSQPDKAEDWMQGHMMSVGRARFQLISALGQSSHEGRHKPRGVSPFCPFPPQHSSFKRSHSTQ